MALGKRHLEEEGLPPQGCGVGRLVACAVGASRWMLPERSTEGYRQWWAGADALSDIIALSPCVACAAVISFTRRGNKAEGGLVTVQSQTVSELRDLDLNVGLRSSHNCACRDWWGRSALLAEVLVPFLLIFQG